MPDEAEASLPVEEKRARLRLLEGLWEEYRGESVAQRQARRQVALKMARLHESLGDYGQARRFYEESLRISEELGDWAGVAITTARLALLEETEGNLESAWELITRAEEMFASLGTPYWEQARRVRERIQSQRRVHTAD